MTVALHILFHSGAEEGLTGVTERKQYARPSIYYLIPTVSLQTGLFSANNNKAHFTTNVHFYDVRSFYGVSFCNRDVAFYTQNLW